MGVMLQCQALTRWTWPLPRGCRC